MRIESRGNGDGFPERVLIRLESGEKLSFKGLCEILEGYFPGVPLEELGVLVDVSEKWMGLGFSSCPYLVVRRIE